MVYNIFLTERRQLTEAAKLLVLSNRPILEIALAAGYQFDRSYAMLSRQEEILWDITFAAEEDIPCWMELVRLVIDSFLYFNEVEYIGVLKQKIDAKEALILKNGTTAIGVMLFSGENGRIDFMGTYPLYRNKGISICILC